MYKSLVDLGVTDECLANSVARQIISNVFGDNVSAILAKPLLWVYFEESMTDFVPSDIKREVVVVSFIQL